MTPEELAALEAEFADLDALEAEFADKPPSSGSARGIPVKSPQPSRARTMQATMQAANRDVPSLWGMTDEERLALAQNPQALPPSIPVTKDTPLAMLLRKLRGEP